MKVEQMQVSGLFQEKVPEVGRRQDRKKSRKPREEKPPKKKKPKGFFAYFIRYVLLFVVVFMAASYVFGDDIFNIFKDDEPKTSYLDSLGGPDEEDELILDYAWIAGDHKNDLFVENNDRFVNGVILGVNDGLTDTIMVVNVDMKKNAVNVISVPRDTFFERDVKGVASLKINAIYQGKNTKQTIRAISETLNGMPIHYYAVIDYKGVEKIVDKIGGVPMDVPFDMKYNDPYDSPPLKIDIKKGYQVLDGEHAIQFLRYRKGYAEGDIGRVKAQQEFVKSAFRQVIGVKLPGAVKEAVRQVDTNMSIENAAKVATKMTGFSKNNIKTYMLPGAPAPYKGGSFYFKADEEVAELVDALYNGISYDGGDSSGWSAGLPSKSGDDDSGSNESIQTEEPGPSEPAQTEENLLEYEIEDGVLDEFDWPTVEEPETEPATTPEDNGDSWLSLFP